MVSYAVFEALWGRLSGDAKNGVPLLQSTRKRLLAFTAGLTFAIALIWVTLTGAQFIVERPLFALLCAFVPFVFLPVPFLVLRTAINLDLLAHLYLLTLYLIVVLVASALGGAVSTTSFFLVLIPLLATLLSGIGGGVAWSVAVGVTFATLHLVRPALPPSAFELVGAFPNEYLSAHQVSLWNAIMMTLLALAASFSVANFRAVVSRSSDLLVEAARETKGAQAAQSIAEELSRSRSEFMANVSHELRTPLNAIIGYSELLIETARDRGDETGAADNQHVLDASLNLRVMVNDILQLSSIDAGRVPVQIEEVDVESVVEDVVMALQGAADAKSNRIDYAVAPGMGLIMSDGAKLDLCLRNLMAHSLQFTSKGLVTVRATADGASLCIEVEDTGADVDDQRLRDFFEPFTQTHTLSAKRFDGPNLGLALARRTARLLKGDITAAAREGGGLRFVLRVPVGGAP